MKFSLKTAQFCNKMYKSASDPFGYGPDEIVQRFGLQLGAVEEVIDNRGKYAGVVTARIVSCEKHPDADKLSVCMIDDNGATPDVDRDEAGLVQVVCGAPNARSGIVVAWIPPGATVPSTINKDPFVLGARKLRGQMSNGMLASPAELDISADHSGILEIAETEFDGEVMLGKPVAELFYINDYIIDCENKMFTHRPDCFGNLGIARELAGIFDEQFTSPDWYTTAIQHDVTADLPVQVANEAPDKVARFIMQSMSDVTVQAAPTWLQAYLTSIGSNTINNIVDYTNYYMMLTAQPLHAYDYHKVAALSGGDTPTVQVRYAVDGEELELLNGKTIKLHKDDLVIATDTQAIGLAGVMGGANTEVDESTKNIILECGTFDMYAVRRMSMRHGLFTDAVTRFNKGQSPLQNDKVLAKIVESLKTDTTQVASPAYDLCAFDVEAVNLNSVQVSADFINSRLGTDLGATDIQRLLGNVEFTVELSSDDSNQDMTITAPFWRMDIAIKEDIVEEVGRLYGYQNVPVVLPARTSKPAAQNQLLEYKQQLRQKLRVAGANEVLTYSFVHGDLLRNTGTDPDKWAYHVRNAISPDLQYYRTSLIPSLLAKVHANIKAGAGGDTNEFALYEIGKAHVQGHNEEDEADLPKEMRRLALVVAADPKTAKQRQNDAYYLAKKYLELIIGQRPDYIPLDTNEYPLTAPYQIGRSAAVLAPSNEQPFAVVGEFTHETRKALKLPEYCAGFEIDIDLLHAEMTATSTYQQMSSYPSSTQDVTYEVPLQTDWSSVYNMLHADLQAHAATTGAHVDVQPLGIYHEKGSDKKRISYRVTIQHMDMTLRSSEVTRLLDLVSASLGSKLDATRI